MVQSSDSMEALGVRDEAVWIEVIQQLDQVYAELVDSQVTLEKKNEELESAQEFIGSVMQAMTDLMIVCDTSGRIEQVNGALTRLTEMDAEQFVGRSVLDILTGANSSAQPSFQQRLASKRHFSNCEVLIEQADGTAISLLVTCSPRFDNQGKQVGLVMIGRPMQELQRAYRELSEALEKFKKAKQQLVSSEKMAALGRLVAGVAHELNNPISVVFGNMHALKSYGTRITRFLQATERDLSHEEIQRLRAELRIDRIAKDILPLVEGTLEGAERVTDIVQDLRRFSGNQRESVDEFSVSRVLQTAVNWVLRGVRNEPEVRIVCGDGIRVRSKKGAVHQILVNLMQNAVDAMDPEGSGLIEIQAHWHKKRLCISVRDQGCGISNDNIGKLFEPFFTTKPVGQGTGLGLYVSYRMADEIGATLTAKNLPDGGACFELNLPETPPTGET